jgi:hypothetical protein
MACDSITPWSLTIHPYTVNRLRVTGGGGTSQSTGEWVKETTSSTVICGSLGRAGTSKDSLNIEMLESLAGGQFKTGDQYFVCHTDCDVSLNDILEVYDDAAGVSKTYWRVITKLKTLTTFKTLRGYGMDYFLVRMEER